MADEELKLTATFVDNVSGPLSDVEAKMRNFGSDAGAAGDISKKMGAAGDAAKEAGESVSGLGSILSGFGGLAGVAATTVGALAVGFQQWAKNAQNLKYASTEIGVSANTLYQFQQAASRLNIEDPTNKLAAFSNRMLGVQLDWGKTRKYFAQHQIGDLFEGLKADLNNPEWDQETRMENAMYRVGNYVKTLADQGEWQKANKLAKDFFGMGAEKVIDLMEKQNQLNREGVVFTKEQAEAAQKYADIIGDLKGAWEQAVVASVPFFSKAMDMMRSMASAVDSGSVKALKDLVLGTGAEKGGDTVWDKILRVLDPGAYARWGTEAQARKVIAAAPESERVGLEFELLTGERKGKKFEEEKARQSAEWWGQAPIREQAPALTPDVQAQLEAQAATFGTGPGQKPILADWFEKFSAAAKATPEAQAPAVLPGAAPELTGAPPGIGVGAGVLEGVKTAPGIGLVTQAAEQVGENLGERIWGGIKNYFSGKTGAAEAFGGGLNINQPLPLGGGGVEAGGEAAAKPAPEAPAFFRGGGWEQAETEGPSPFEVLQIKPGQQPIDLAAATQPARQPPQEDVSLAKMVNVLATAMEPAPDTGAPLTAREVLAPQDQGFNWDGFQYDKMRSATAQEHTVRGEATLTVDVNAPNGTKVKSGTNGDLFRTTRIKRGRQMAWSADAETGDDWE